MSIVLCWSLKTPADLPCFMAEFIMDEDAGAEPVDSAALPASPLQSASTATGSLQSSPLGSVVYESIDDAVRLSVAAIPCDATRAALHLIVTMVDQSRFSHGDEIHQNVIRLLSHLGAAPVVRPRLSSSSGASTPSSSRSKADITKPHCPWCLSSKFVNEKNLVAHLNDAISKVGAVASSPRSCRYDPVHHNSLMGLPGSQFDSTAARAFMIGYRSCFLASGLTFDIARSARASHFLSGHVGAAAAPQ